MSDRAPRFVPGTYSLDNRDWENAFGSKDERPANLLRQDAITELNKPQSPAYWAMKQNFKQIDLDGNGFLSPDEIKTAAKTDPALAKLDADPKLQFEIKHLMNDGRNGAQGISMHDINAYGIRDVRARIPQDMKHAADFLYTYFDKLNTTRDGFLSKTELNKLIDEPNLKSSFRQKFLLIDQHFDAVSELNREKILRGVEHRGLSKNDLKVLIANDGKINGR